VVPAADRVMTTPAVSENGLVDGDRSALLVSEYAEPDAGPTLNSTLLRFRLVFDIPAYSEPDTEFIDAGGG